jgi:FAD-linked sulfhydryl oxidase
MVVLGAVALFLVFIVYTADHGNDHLHATRVQSANVLSDSHATVSVYSSPPAKADARLLPPAAQHAKPIASKLGNETLKAELGRAAWKLFHTTMARFPDTPTQDESDALKSYIYLFARLYPCGECAEHFQGILKNYPPQTSTRSTAAAWACFVHNEVNISKGKEVFDCGNIGDFYDCGCAEDEEKKDAMTTKKSGVHEEPFEITREGLTNGG